MIKPKRIFASSFPNTDVVETTCTCLGTRIRDQMYQGVSPDSSTLVSGQYDDEDNWDVDPACDMSTDRFELDLKERVPIATPTSSSEE